MYKRTAKRGGGGGIEKGDRTRSEMRGERKRDAHRTHKFFLKKTMSFHQKQHMFFSYNFPFYKMKKIENFRMKRCLEDGEGSYGSYTICSGLVLGLFKDLIINDMEIRGISLIPC